MSEADSRATSDVLRDKYLDYCSAQLADLLLYLSPDDIYILARREARAEGDELAMSYGAMVRGATKWLHERVALPPFEVWLEDYRAHPELYEEYFMGLWESDAEEPT